MMMAGRCRVAGVGVLLLALVSTVAGHGALISPRSRNSVDCETDNNKQTDTQNRAFIRSEVLTFRCVHTPQTWSA